MGKNNCTLKENVMTGKSSFVQMTAGSAICHPNYQLTPWCNFQGIYFENDKMSGKPKYVGRLETEIEKNREESNWKKVAELADQLSQRSPECGKLSFWSNSESLINDNIKNMIEWRQSDVFSFSWKILKSQSNVIFFDLGHWHWLRDRGAPGPCPTLHFSESAYSDHHHGCGIDIV